jgi:Uri superfamily endonuclease
LNQLLEIGLDAKTIQGCYERYKWHIDYYKDAVILKNIDLAEIDLEEQKRKVVEEENEFMDAFFEYTISNKSEKFKNHVIEELWDEFQAKLGLLEKEGIAAKEVMKEYPKHLEKIKHRPR